MDLVTAVKVESFEKIKEIIIKQGIPVDAKWIDYKMLNVSLNYGRKDVAMFLLDRHCRVNKNKKLSAKESTPLHHAAKLGDVQIVKKLLKKQALVLAIDTDKNTPLHLAFINKHEALVDLLLDNIDQSSSHINLKNNQGLSHFHIACTAQSGKAIQGFIDAGADVNDAVDVKSSFCAGFTALHFAVNYKCLDALSILLKLDAKHEIKTTGGKTPLDIACEKVEDWLIMIDLLKKKSSNPTVRNCLSNFHVACLREDKKVVENFIKHGVDVNSRYQSFVLLFISSSSLHWAVLSGCKNKVELLLKHGCTLNCTNVNGMTPLHQALYNEEFDNKETTEIVDLLYNTVEDKMIEQKDYYGMSLFHVAITRNDVTTAKKYLEEGKADVNGTISGDAYQFRLYSPLHLAVKYQYPEMVTLLLDYEADINACDAIECIAPIHIAFENGDTDIIDLLLKNGAKVDLLYSEEKWSLLHILILSYQLSDISRRDSQLCQNKEATMLYIEHLIKLGIDVNAKDKVGDTALCKFRLSDFNNDDVSVFQLLLDFGADINVQNNDGCLPFEGMGFDFETNDSNFYLMYYQHVQKLKAIGLYVHPENEEYCQKIVEKKNCKEDQSKQQQRLDEIAKLKSIKIGEVTTLCDFLKLDSRRAALFAQCKTLKKIIMDSGLKEKFPVYGYLIQSQYNVAVKTYKNNKCPSGFTTSMIN